MTATPTLVCRSLDAGYGSTVVHAFDLVLGGGEVLALLGPNGAGKTTLLNTLAGLQRPLGGEVELFGAPAPLGRARRLSRLGVVLVPDDRALFRSLTTRENLQLARRRGGPSIDQVLAYFPDLGKRMRVAAGAMSGGEQQMLAIGRALMQNPKLLLIDELSMGLAPVIVGQLLPIIRKVATDFRTSVILVEQHVRLALSVADRAVVLAHGEQVIDAPAAELVADPVRLERAYLGQPTPA